MISCEQCFYFNEDFGDYFESYYDCHCGNPMMSDFFDARGVIDHDYFPFSPAPGCFKLSPWLAPDHMLLKRLKKWSGDLIELVDGK